MPTTAELESAWRAGGGHLGKPNWMALRAAYGTAVGFPLTGYSGGGGGYATESSAIFAAFTTPPTDPRKALIDACVVALKSAGVWVKLDFLYVYAAADRQAAIINWVAPGTYNCAEVGAPTFTADQGFTGASAKYLDTGFNPTTAPTPKFVQNSSSIFAWSTTVSANDIMMGTAAAPGTSGESFLLPWYPAGSNSFFGRVLSSGDQVLTPNPYASGLGLWVGSRTGAAVTDFYRNGAASFLTSAVASAAPATANINIMNRGGQGSTGTIAASGLGQSLSAADNTALYNALRTYLTGVGVP